MTATHKCAECGGSVEVTDGVIARDCGHDEAAVAAELSAVVYGESKAES